MNFKLRKNKFVLLALLLWVFVYFNADSAHAKHNVWKLIHGEPVSIGQVNECFNAPFSFIPENLFLPVQGANISDIEQAATLASPPLVSKILLIQKFPNNKSPPAPYA